MQNAPATVSFNQNAGALHINDTILPSVYSFGTVMREVDLLIGSLPSSVDFYKAGLTQSRS